MHSEFENKHFVFVLGQLSKLGGAERQALILSQHLRDNVGANVSFLAWSDPAGILGEHLDSALLPVRVFKIGWGHGDRAKKGIGLARLANFVRKEIRPDFLLPYVGEASKIVGSIWKLTGARYTWWNQRDEGRDVHGSALERYLMRTLPDVVSNSWEGRDFLMRTFNLARDRVRIINNAIVIPQSTDPGTWRSGLGIGDADWLSVMVANLTEHKDHVTLLKAFASAQKQLPPHRTLHLALAGRLAEKTEELKALAFDLGLAGSLHFLGEVRDIDSLYEAADIVVHSSVAEGCPNAALEGMAHAKCVVGTDISGMRQALGEAGSDGKLASPRDADGLARIIVRHLVDDDLRKRSGTSNRARIQSEFSVKQLADSVLSGIARYSTKGH
jgi:glycosyltransferase involved in cell wall biosynthesis